MKKFLKNNESFICHNCGHQVKPHPTSSRDHCTECLFGQHVDINPGDRANTCKGKLIPIGIDKKGSNTRIVYKCKSCNKLVFCKAAPDDNSDEILKLFSKIWKS